MPNPTYPTPTFFPFPLTHNTIVQFFVHHQLFSHLIYFLDNFFCPSEVEYRCIIPILDSGWSEVGADTGMGAREGTAREGGGYGMGQWVARRRKRRERWEK